MLQASQLLLLASTVLTLVALICYLTGVLVARQAAPKRSPHMATVGGTAEVDEDKVDVGEDPVSDTPATPTRGVIWFASTLMRTVAIMLSLSLLLRGIATGHAPFANQYEFALSFAWGMVVAHVYFEWRYRLRTLAVFVLPLVFAMLLYASTLSYEANPLVPALQNSPLLTMHVFTAAVGYGTAAVSFGAAVMYLLAPRISWSGWPKQELLDEVGYKAVIATFPLLTIMLILGSIWANIAWGRYWSWDPKETAALVTWFIYGAYLHARVTRDWRGGRAAWLLILGFAAILFTYFGNLFFGGMHAYA